jgi:YVTN family beta-propeller protein
VDFRILGPLQVRDGDADVPLGSPKEQALLAVLLLHAGEVVSRGRLIDELWSESPPPTAAKALNVHVSQLRKSLARDGVNPIGTHAPGYVLQIDPELFDAARFERLVEDARARAAEGNEEAAGTRYREALSLWRGAALDGIELGPASRSEIGRLDELRISADMERIDCELALGRHDQVVGELEALIAEHPLRERLRGQYMLALYRSGRQADALRAYKDTRQTLVDRLGLEPSEPLQRLERAILNHDPALELPAGVPRPTPQQRRRGWLRPVALGALVVLVGVVIAVFLATRHESATTVAPNSVAVIDPATNEVVGSVAVGVDPEAVTIGGGSVWAANTADETVSRIDARTRRLLRTIPVGENPGDLSFAAGSAWVALGARQQVQRIDLTRNAVDDSISATVKNSGLNGTDYFCSRRGMWVAAGAGALWIACDYGEAPPISDAFRIDLRTRKVTPVPNALTVTAPVPVRFRDVAVGLGSVWYVNHDANSVSQVDAATLQKLRDVPVGEGPVAAAVGYGSVWVTNEDDDTVSRIRVAGPTQGVTVDTIPIGSQPVDVAVGDGAVWVANGRDRTLSRIDPRTDKVVATIGLGNEPVRLAAGDGAVWVTVQGPEGR